jgi:hypothetical protein
MLITTVQHSNHLEICGCCFNVCCPSLLSMRSALHPLQVSGPLNTTGLRYPWSMPNPVTATDGLVIRGNVFVNWHSNPKYLMSLGLGACTAAMPCAERTVSHKLPR